MAKRRRGWFQDAPQYPVDVLYHEVTPQPLLAAALTSVAVLCVSLLVRSLVGAARSGGAGWPLVLGALTLLFTALASNLALLEVRIARSGLYVGFGILRYHVSWNAVEAVSWDDLSPWTYLGVGIRAARRAGGWRLAYIGAGRYRLVLRLSGHRAREFAFTVSDPDRALSALRVAMVLEAEPASPVRGPATYDVPR